MIFYEKCPTCNNKLEAIQDDVGEIIDWFCSQCGISWTLEDLEYEPLQKTLDEWLC